MAKTAVEKRDGAALPHVETLTVSKGADFPAGLMLVSSPLEVQAVIARIPEGRVLTLSALRTSVAKSHKADYACPQTTPLFVGVVAEAAEEERTLGKKPVPYWRVVRDDGTLIDSLPGGIAAQAKRLERDGVELFHMGQVPRVAYMKGAAWKAPPYGKAAGKPPTPTVTSGKPDPRAKR